MMKRTIDSVAMTRRIRDTHYQQLKGKSISERIVYYRNKANAIHSQRPLDKTDSVEPTVKVLPNKPV
jgi:hypothetical protein